MAGGMDPGAQARLAASLGSIAQKVNVSAPALGDHAPALPGFASVGGSSREMSNQEARIYVGSIAFDVTADEVKRLFSPFGVVQKVDMSKGDGNNKGGSKGFCFVWFQDTQSAMGALGMDGFQLGDRQIKVGLPSDNPGAAKELESKDGEGPIASYAVANDSPFVLVLNIPSLLSCDMLSSVLASFGKVVSCVVVSSSNQQQQPSTALPPPPPPEQGQERPIWSAQVQFSVVESAYTLITAVATNGVLLGGNLLTVQSLRAPIKPPVVPPPPAQPQPQPQSESSSGGAGAGAGTQVRLLNMVTWSEAQREGAALEKEIAAECAKFGVLLNLSIEPLGDGTSGSGSGSSGGDGAAVLLEYESEDGATSAIKALHDRFFAGKRVVAQAVA